MIIIIIIIIMNHYEWLWIIILYCKSLRIIIIIIVVIYCLLLSLWWWFMRLQSRLLHFLPWNIPEINQFFSREVMVSTSLRREWEFERTNSSSRTLGPWALLLNCCCKSVKICHLIQAANVIVLPDLIVMTYDDIWRHTIQYSISYLGISHTFPSIHPFQHGWVDISPTCEGKSWP